MSARHGLERGSGTVWMLALVALLSTVTAAVAVVIGIDVGRHRADAAADLAALSAAARIAQGEQAACATARSVARAQRTRLLRCVSDAGEVVVVVEVRARPRFGVPLRMTGRARAGPSGPPSEVDGLPRKDPPAP